MKAIDNPEVVKAQYFDDRNLAARAALHAKHSINQQGYGAWIFEKYAFDKGFRILELGCGNAYQWAGRLDHLPEGCSVVLTDLSKGMVETVWSKFSDCRNLLALRVDISDIPFPDEAFDAVIANHMLYHVPDLDRALAEVWRVLKPGGRFYCATNGENGMHAYLHKELKTFNPALEAFGEPYSFSLQNGAAMLERYFEEVERCDYEDALHITRTEDLMSWIASSLDMAGLNAKDLDGLAAHFEKIRGRDGAICIPKENGLFICGKRAGARQAG